MMLYNGPTRSRVETKETSPQETHKGVETYQFNPAGGPLTVTDWYWTKPASSHSFSSLYAPKFNRLKEEGWVMQFPYSQYSDNWSMSPSYIRDDWYQGTTLPNHTWGTYDNFVDFFLDPQTFPATKTFDDSRKNASDEVLTRVYAKANSAQADLLIDLSQYRDTVRMFVNALRRLRNLAGSVGAFTDFLRRGNQNRRVRVPPHGESISIREISGLWCELRFGWRPLLVTLDGVIDALNDLHGQSKRTTYRSQEEFSFDDEVTTTSHPATFGFTGTVYKTTKVKYRSTFRAGLLMEHTSTLAEALGLDAKYIPIALWDIIPYSFILDRFVNVGNYIRSLNPIPLSKFGGSWIVERFECDRLYKCEYVAHSKSSGSGSSYRRWDRSGGSNQATHASSGVIRTIYSRPPPLPVLRHDWSEFQDLYNLIDVLFLAIQRVRIRQ